MKPNEKLFNKILAEAKTDPNILAFWLDGSRGKGLVTKYSDYDCTLVVKDEVLAEYEKKYENLKEPGIDSNVRSISSFYNYAAWGSPTAWDRYNFAHLKPLVDKTGKIQKLFREKSVVPKNEIKNFIAGSLDHYINQVYRSLKNFRDGRVPAARLEAAEQIAPLLDALFALNDGRLKPYYKYLVWELEKFPLKKFPLSRKRFIEKLLTILETADVKTQQEIFLKTEKLFRQAGYATVFDGWGHIISWIKEFKN
jgi:predicted nucleotidyltransferase